jgi:hypothetical protein
MSDTLTRPPATSGGGPEQPFRPGRPVGGIGRRLRRVAGVNEKIMNWVPEERPRYTRLGAIVVNTALMAGVSMLVLLSKTDLPVLLTVPLALVWAYLILTFDGWLVASTHGVTGRAKLAIYLPRILISALMGAVIAEPLLLSVFAPAIHTEVNQQRKNTVDDYETLLKQCNPVSGLPPQTAGCPEQLNVENPLVSIRQELLSKTAQRTAQRKQITAANRELGRREAVSRAECNGTKINATTTGVVGEGPNCDRNRKEADRFREASRIAEREAAAATLDQEIIDLTARESQAGREFAAALHTEIVAKVAEERRTQEKVGILDEVKALDALAARSTFVDVGSWLLRLLLIVVDCLPVLTKLMSRRTTYDLLLTRQLAMTDRLHDKYATEQERRDATRRDVEIKRLDHEYAASVERIDEADRATRADRQATLGEQIKRLAAKLRDDAED